MAMTLRWSASRWQGSPGGSCDPLSRSHLQLPRPHQRRLAALQMNRDLGFSSTAFGLGAGVFFVGYAFFEIPSNLALVRFGARRWIARIAISWGILAGLLMFVNTPMQFYVVRFLLGVAEAGFFPAVLYYLTQWYPSSMRARANARFIIAIPLSGAIGGPLGAKLLGLDGTAGLHGWQWLFRSREFRRYCSDCWCCDFSRRDRRSDLAHPTASADGGGADAPRPGECRRVHGLPPCARWPNPISGSRGFRSSFSIFAGRLHLLGRTMIRRDSTRAPSTGWILGDRCNERDLSSSSPAACGPHSATGIARAFWAGVARWHPGAALLTNPIARVA